MVMLNPMFNGHKGTEQARHASHTQMQIQLIRLGPVPHPSRLRSLRFLLLNLFLFTTAAGFAAQFTTPTDPTCGLGYMKALPGAGTNAPAGQNEYDVKAAVLYRCLELVQWPAPLGVAAGPQTPIKIGVLGKNPFGASLDSFSRKVLVGRPLVVTRLSSVAEAAGCNLVFISASEKKQTSKILKNLAGLPVLTVGETPGFVEAGGMLNLVLDGKNLRLDVNKAAADKAGITFDPQLVKLAQLTTNPSRS